MKGTLTKNCTCRSEEGYILPFVSVVMLAILAYAFVVYKGTVNFRQKLRVQAYLDSALRAGVNASPDKFEVFEAACNTLAAHMFAQSSGSFTCAVARDCGTSTAAGTFKCDTSNAADRANTGENRYYANYTNIDDDSGQFKCDVSVNYTFATGMRDVLDVNGVLQMQPITGKRHLMCVSILCNENLSLSSLIPFSRIHGIAAQGCVGSFPSSAVVVMDTNSGVVKSSDEHDVFTSISESNLPLGYYVLGANGFPAPFPPRSYYDSTPESDILTNVAYAPWLALLNSWSNACGNPNSFPPVAPTTSITPAVGCYCPQVTPTSNTIPACMNWPQQPFWRQSLGGTVLPAQDYVTSKLGQLRGVHFGPPINASGAADLSAPFSLPFSEAEIDVNTTCTLLGCNDPNQDLPIGVGALSSVVAQSLPATPDFSIPGPDGNADPREYIRDMPTNQGETTVVVNNLRYLGGASAAHSLGQMCYGGAGLINKWVAEHTLYLLDYLRIKTAVLAVSNMVMPIAAFLPRTGVEEDPSNQHYDTKLLNMRVPAPPAGEVGGTDLGRDQFSTDDPVAGAILSSESKGSPYDYNGAVSIPTQILYPMGICARYSDPAQYGGNQNFAALPNPYRSTGSPALQVPALCPAPFAPNYHEAQPLMGDGYCYNVRIIGPTGTGLMPGLFHKHRGFCEGALSRPETSGGEMYTQAYIDYLGIRPNFLNVPAGSLPSSTFCSNQIPPPYPPPPFFEGLSFSSTYNPSRLPLNCDMSQTFPGASTGPWPPSQCPGTTTCPPNMLPIGGSPPAFCYDYMDPGDFGSASITAKNLWECNDTFKASFEVGDGWMGAAGGAAYTLPTTLNPPYPVDQLLAVHPGLTQPFDYSWCVNQDPPNAALTLHSLRYGSFSKSGFFGDVRAPYSSVDDCGSGSAANCTKSSFLTNRYYPYSTDKTFLSEPLANNQYNSSSIQVPKRNVSALSSGLENALALLKRPDLVDTDKSKAIRTIYLVTDAEPNVAIRQLISNPRGLGVFLRDPPPLSTVPDFVGDVNTASEKDYAATPPTWAGPSTVPTRSRRVLDGMQEALTLIHNAASEGINVVMFLLRTPAITDIQKSLFLAGLNKPLASPSTSCSGICDANQYRFCRPPEWGSWARSEEPPVSGSWPPASFPGNPPITADTCANVPGYPGQADGITAMQLNINPLSTAPGGANPSLSGGPAFNNAYVNADGTLNYENVTIDGIRGMERLIRRQNKWFVTR